MNKLIQIKDGEIIRKPDLCENEYLLGFDDSNNIVFNGDLNYAVLKKDGNSYLIKAIDRGDYVRINGHKTSSKLLKSGDVIDIGDNIKLFYIKEEKSDNEIKKSINDFINKAISYDDLIELQEIFTSMLSVTDLDTILNRILDDVIATVQAERGMIILLKGQAPHFHSSVSRNMEFDFNENYSEIDANTSGPTAWIKKAIEEKIPLFINDIENNPFSVMCAPLIVKDKVIGVLYVDAQHFIADFAEHNKLIFTILASQAAIAINNAQIYADLDKRVQERTQQLTDLNKTLMDKINERNKIEQDLIDSELRYKLLAKTIPDSVNVIDKNGIIIYRNRPNPIYGDIRGKKQSEIYPKEVAEKHDYEINRVFETGKTIHSEETYKTNLGKVWMDYYLVPMKSSAGKTIAVLTVSRDITSHKKIEEELLKAKEVAENANQAKSEFLTSMSHEVRTPLNAIIGFADLLIEYEDSTEKAEMIKLIKQSGTALLEVINDIVDLSKIESGKIKLFREKINIIDTINSINRDFNNMAAMNSIYYEYEISPSVHENKNLIGDEFKLKQILANIITNAIKFTEEGGVTVKFNIKEKFENKIILEVIVTDTGIGISSDMIDKIFEEFVQAEHYLTKKQKGTGLGLTIVNSLVKIMDGSISVKSELNKGSEFIIHLPLELDRRTGSSGIAVPDFQISENSFTGTKLLIVEDDIVNQTLIKRLALKYNIDVEVAENGLEALQKIGQQNFNIVLMDIMMPVMDGLTATKKIRAGEAGESNSDIPIIALTAHAMKEQHIQFVEAGLDYVIVKPVDVRELLFIIKKFSRIN